MILSWHILYLSTPPLQLSGAFYHVLCARHCFPNTTFSITVIFTELFILTELLKGGCVTVLLVRARVRIQVCDPKARALCLYFMQPLERQL